MRKFKTGDRVKFIKDGAIGSVFAYGEYGRVLVELDNTQELLKMANRTFRFGREDEIEFLEIKSDPEFEKGWESNET